MIEFGRTLRTAREAKGCDIGQIAEMTRMAPTTIQELEAEDFSRIAAPIYGRGFVKLYCEAVGIDPKPLIAEFMELYNGTRDTEIKERSVHETAKPVAEPPCVNGSVAAEPPEEAPALSVPNAPISEPAPDHFRQGSELPETPTSDVEPESPTLSRYAAPMRQARATFDPQVYLRLCVLALTAAVLIGLVVFGLRAVYRATMTASVATEESQTEEPVTSAVSAPPPKAEKANKAPVTPEKPVRTPQEIPSLYID